MPAVFRSLTLMTYCLGLCKPSVSIKSLQWRHMRANVYQIAGYSPACSIDYLDKHQNERQSSALLAFCQRNPLVNGGFQSERTINVQGFPCHDVSMHYFCKDVIAKSSIKIDDYFLLGDWMAIYYVHFLAGWKPYLSYVKFSIGDLWAAFDWLNSQANYELIDLLINLLRIDLLIHPGRQLTK